MKNQKVIRIKDDEQKPTRYYSSLQEKTAARKLNGKVQPNSGATEFAKGDVALEDFLLEYKTKMTESKSMSVKKEWLEKTASEALWLGKLYFALGFNFGPNEKNYYIVDEETFQLFVK